VSRRTEAGPGRRAVTHSDHTALLCMVVVATAAVSCFFMIGYINYSFFVSYDNQDYSLFAVTN
jgi:hypothetical protein